jgi:flagellar biosynthetic protein FliO
MMNLMQRAGIILIIAMAFLFNIRFTVVADDSAGFDIAKVREAVQQGAGNLADDSSGRFVQTAGQANQANITMVILRIIGSLVLIVALIFGLVWSMRRMGVAGSSRAGGGAMDILETLPCGPNRLIMLVRVMDSVLVLAQTQQQITLLDKVVGEKAVELIASTKGGTSIVRFKDVLSSFVDKMKNK